MMNVVMNRCVDRFDRSNAYEYVLMQITNLAKTKELLISIRKSEATNLSNVAKDNADIVVVKDRLLRNRFQEVRAHELRLKSKIEIIF